MKNDEENQDFFGHWIVAGLSDWVGVGFKFLIWIFLGFSF